MSHFVLGVLAQKAGRYEEALAAVQQAEEANRLRKGSVVLKLHASMADCLARLGREAEAERGVPGRARGDPWSPGGPDRARHALPLAGPRCRGADRPGRAGGGQPRPSADAYWTVVHTFTVLGDTAAARDWASPGPREVPERRPLSSLLSWGCWRRTPRPPLAARGESRFAHASPGFGGIVVPLSGGTASTPAARPRSPARATRRTRRSQPLRVAGQGPFAGENRAPISLPFTFAPPSWISSRPARL